MRKVSRKSGPSPDGMSVQSKQVSRAFRWEEVKSIAERLTMSESRMTLTFADGETLSFAASGVKDDGMLRKAIGDWAIPVLGRAALERIASGEIVTLGHISLCQTGIGLNGQASDESADDEDRWFWD